MNASLYEAIADPTRRALLRALRDGSRSAGDLAAPFELSKPTLSHHLKVLREAGLVRAEKRGTRVVYSLSANVLEELAAELLDLAGAAALAARASPRKRGPS
ncbi:MAG TPA: metalloregulator ArsR/SmtB family transcription factor [Polyangiaceae bacterium]|nr:metalloregulator ArsR/SmtB family transcription factor [Polyangiaceae bacterium]